jgi:hypothetical protein
MAASPEPPLLPAEPAAPAEAEEEGAAKEEEEEVEEEEVVAEDTGALASVSVGLSGSLAQILRTQCPSIMK